MKRLAAVALSLVVLVLGFNLTTLAESAGSTALSVGSAFVFGRYEQDNDSANGEEPIEWIVLANEGEKVLLLSLHALDCQVYSSLKTKVTWENSELRTWLNTVFMEKAFIGAEQEAILRQLYQMAIVRAMLNGRQWVETIPRTECSF